jgi:hypothetical protein
MAPNRRTRWWAAAGFLAVGLPTAGWLWLDALDRPVTPRLVSGPPRVADAEHPLVTVGRALHAVRPGMPRAEVESALGPPDPAGVGPVVRDGERAVYHTRYRAVLTEAAWCAPNLRGPCEAVLEFDATRPGHPLLGVVCTPAPPPPGTVTAT